MAESFCDLFNILHPPLNVPAFGKLIVSIVPLLPVDGAFIAVSLNDDVDTNKELVAHGYSNFLAGLIGTLYV